MSNVAVYKTSNLDSLPEDTAYLIGIKPKEVL